jgi:hypothetical protein
MVENRAYEKTDTSARRPKGRRMVKLPGEKRHVERSDSATYFARKVDLDKREKRLKALTRND